MVRYAFLLWITRKPLLIMGESQMSEMSIHTPHRDETDTDSGRHWPYLTLMQWMVFTVLAGALAAVNIYSTLLIGWGDTGSIIAVLASVFLLGLMSRRKPHIYILNLGQTMVSAGGSVGFAVASYAAVRIIDPNFVPPWWQVIPLFAAMGVVGALVGSSVRRQMVRYFFPSGTACAVIQRSVVKDFAPGERNRPIFMLKLWGGISALATIPTKITPSPGGSALLHNWNLSPSLGIGLGVDPLFYGIGLIVGPRIGLGMAIGGLAVPLLFTPLLAGSPYAAELGNWVTWNAIALLTLPTFATIVFAYMFRQPPVVPPGFTPGATKYRPPRNFKAAYGIIGILMAGVIAWTSQVVFGMPFYVTIITIIIAWPLCIVNGRVSGDTDINPVRLVAIVLLSGFFWLLAGAGAIAMLGMAVVAGTLASVAVDMMQDYRTGYLIDANPTHQTSVQFVGAIVGSVIAVPTMSLLIKRLGIGDNSGLPAPGAKVWAAMAEAMAGGFDLSTALIRAIVIVSIVGCLYAFLTVWPKSAWLMPSLFGMGIGLLLGTEACTAIFAGGLLKSVIKLFYTFFKSGKELTEARYDASNDTMLAGASIFAAGAVVAIILILATPLLDALGLNWWYLAQ
jgi:uncharacterized oligopeptide transporter (OPT) family protein